MQKVNKIKTVTSPSRYALLKNKEEKLQKALESNPIDKELINRGRELERNIQARKARGTSSSAVRKEVK